MPSPPASSVSAVSILKQQPICSKSSFRLGEAEARIIIKNCLLGLQMYLMQLLRYA